MKKTIVTIMLLASSQLWAENVGTAEIQGAQFLTVGADNDNACDYHSIQAAINSGFSNTIRIASNKNYLENIEVQSLNRDLIGGYADCTQAGLNITDLSQAAITANGTDTGIYVNNASGNERTVTLRNLIVANAGAGVTVNSQNPGSMTQVTLNNVRVFNNNGRGVSVQDLNTATAELIIYNSIIDFNNGGFACDGSGTIVKISGSTLIQNNQTNDYGGGIRANNGCDLSIYSPTIISDNESDQSGGGIYVTNASAVLYGWASTCENGICFGQWETPVTIENNIANAHGMGFGSGGGIAVANGGSVDVVNALLKGNEAYFGGGLSVDNGQATVIGYESPGTPCWSKSSCVQFNGNKATSGGAISAMASGTITVYQSTFTANRANSGVIAQTAAQGELSINNSLIYNNGANGAGDYSDSQLFRLFPGENFPSSTMALDFVTISDNQVVGEAFDNGNGDLDVTSSIVFNENDTYVSSGNSPQGSFECVMASENSSFSAGGTVTVVDPVMQPVFVNPAVGNYHLLVDSPAIDYCYDASGNAGADIDYDSRGVDNPDVINFHGSYDLGADEFNINNDIIFKNGFEQI